jgi:hypothetical protein
VRELEQFGFPQWHGTFMLSLAETHRLRGAIDTARELARRGLAITTACRYWLAVGYGQRVLGRIAAETGALGEAEAHFTDALATFTSIGAQAEVGRTALELATLAARRGDRATALRHAEAAEAALRELDLPAHHERAERLATELRHAG